MATNALIAELKARGLIAQTTADEELNEHLNEGGRVVYVGFDPTADSLHIGSLVPLLTLKRFQMAGHKPLALVGGATGLIGDPSFKAQERQLNMPEVVIGWGVKIKQQLCRFIDFDCGENSAEVVNNLEWTENLGVLSFLRDIGKHFSVSQMIKKESVKQRIEREGEGISFTEFTYSILQSLDFSELYNRKGCTVQIGGSDQWGNIVGGTELTRRRFGGQVFGVTLPLVTKSDGTKFGKTESGTVWLDPKKTSPYAFYQFWLNTTDADVYKFLRYFTFLSPQEVDRIEASDRASSGRPEGQRILAEKVTRLIHGEEGLAAAQRISKALFEGDIKKMSKPDFDQLRLDGLPSTRLGRRDFNGRTLTQILTECELAVSGKQVKDALGRKSVLINGDAIGAEGNTDVAGCFVESRAMYDKYYLVKLGKKKYHLFDID